MIFEGAVSASEGLVAFLLDENPRAKINGMPMKSHNITVWKKVLIIADMKNFRLRIARFSCPNPLASGTGLKRQKVLFSLRTAAFFRCDHASTTSQE